MTVATTRYLVGIEVNQKARGIIRDVLNDFSTAIPLPFPHLIPLFDSAEKPSEPVPGLLPRPTHLSTSSRLETAVFPGPWLVWRVEDGNWLENLTTAFHSRGWVTHPESTLLPCARGIPVAVLEEGSSDTGENSSRIIQQPWPKTDWTALKMVCLELEFSTELLWYKAAIWRSCWKRSLRRISGTSEIPSAET